MKKTMRLFTMLYLMLFIINPAKAAFDSWDTASPWGSTPLYYVGWNVFNTLPVDSTPDNPGSGTGFVDFYPYSGGPQFLASTSYYGSGNVVMPNPSGNISGIFSTTISGMDATQPGTFDVYVRVETYKAPPLSDATLYSSSGASITATSVVSYNDPNYAEYEYYWLFSGVAAASDYIIKVLNVGNLYNQTSFMQLEVAVVGTIVPVPEPQTSSLMFIGLFIMASWRKLAPYLKKAMTQENIKPHTSKAAAVALLALASANANAAIDTWDSATPWGSATTAFYVGWNVFDQVPVDSTPEVSGSGSGSFTMNVLSSGFFGGGNVYSPPNTMNGSYSIVMQGTPGGYYDIYLRIETGRTVPTTFTAATLIIDDDIASNLGLSNDFQSTQVISFYDQSSGLNEAESYWVWTNIPGSNFYNVMLSQNSQQYYTIFAQAEMAAVAIPVPEANTSILFVAGLLSIGFMRLRRNA